MRGQRFLAVLGLAATVLLNGFPAAKALDEASRNLLPQLLRDKGALTAGLPLDFEPWNYLDDKNEQVGLDIDVFRAVADVLGLKPEVMRLGFASIIPAITGGRGTLIGTLIGVALLGTIGTALTFVGINPLWEKAIQGLIILAALVSDVLLAQLEKNGKFGYSFGNARAN